MLPDQMTDWFFVLCVSFGCRRLLYCTVCVSYLGTRTDRGPSLGPNTTLLSTPKVIALIKRTLL